MPDTQDERPLRRRAPGRTRTRRYQVKARSAEDQEQLRQRFIDVGRQLLNESYDGQVSLRQIARIVGYSPSALYRYFPTKAALVYAVREDHLRLSTEFAQQEVAAVTDPLARFCVGFEAMVAFWAGHPLDFLRLFSYRLQDGDPTNLSMSDSSITAAARSFKQELVSDLFRSRGVEPATDLLKLLTDSAMVASHGVISVPLGSPSMKYCSPGQLARSVVASMTAGWLAFIAAHGPTPPGQPASAEDYLRFCAGVGRPA